MKLNVGWIAFLLLVGIAVGCGGGDEVVNPSGPPAAPSQLAVNSVTASQIVLSWIDNSGTETEFGLERAPGATTSFTQIATIPADTTTHTDAGLAKLTEFCYRVRATNAAGSSEYSNTICGATDTAIPAAPSSLAVSSTTVSAINLIWTDNSSNEDGFRIERAPGTTTTFAEITTVGPNIAAFSDTGLGSDQTFTYRVRAFNVSGNSPYSNSVPGTTGTAPPSAPSGLFVVSRTTEQIAIAWTDNSSNETGFRIERAAGGPTGTFSGIATVGAGIVAFTDTGPGPNQTFTYRVRAFNLGGDSAPSNTVTEKTFISYASQVHPFFSASPACTGCHTGGTPAGGLNLSGSASSVYPAVSARSNIGLPCDSLILKKPSRTTCLGGVFSHSGGTLWSTSSTQYIRTRDWIQEGAQNN